MAARGRIVERRTTALADGLGANAAFLTLLIFGAVTREA